MINLYFILPEIFISLSIMVLLILGVFKNNSSKLIYTFSYLVIIISLAINVNISDNFSLFNNSYLIDDFSSFIKSIIFITAFFVMLCSYNYVKIGNFLM